MREWGSGLQEMRFSFFKNDQEIGCFVFKFYFCAMTKDIRVFFFWFLPEISGESSSVRRFSKQTSVCDRTNVPFSLFLLSNTINVNGMGFLFVTYLLHASSEKRRFSRTTKCFTKQQLIIGLLYFSCWSHFVCVCASELSH